MAGATRFSFIERFAELTGCTDSEIARIAGAGADGKPMARSTVQAYRTRRLDENLTDAQKQRLTEAAQAYRREVYEMVAEMELYS